MRRAVSQMATDNKKTFGEQLVVDVSSAVSQISEWFTGAKPAQEETELPSVWSGDYCGDGVHFGDECAATNLDSNVEEMNAFISARPQAVRWNADFCMGEVEYECEAGFMDSQVDDLLDVLPKPKPLVYAYGPAMDLF